MPAVTTYTDIVSTWIYASGSVQVSRLVGHSDDYGVRATVIWSSTFPYHRRNSLTAAAHYHLLQEHKPLPTADWYMICMTFLPSHITM